MISGYDHQRVRRFVREHGSLRASDGRVMQLNGRMLAESYRNTLATWLEHDIDIVPLARWDAILISVGLMLIPDYETWELETYGDLSYVENVATISSEVPNPQPKD